MGLSVTLIWCQEANAAVAAKRELSRLWRRGQTERYYARLKENFAGPEQFTGAREVTRRSRRHPAYTLGSFGSSHTGTSFNPVLKSYGAPDLYEIFQPPRRADERVWFIPDWRRALTKARAALRILRARRREKLDVFQVMPVAVSPGPRAAKLKNTAQALRVFEEEWRRNSTVKPSLRFPAYTGPNGEFRLDGITTRGFMPGRYLNEACVYVAYDDRELFADHLKTLEVVEETILYCARRRFAGRHFLYWSD